MQDYSRRLFIAITLGTMISFVGCQQSTPPAPEAKKVPPYAKGLEAELEKQMKELCIPATVVLIDSEENGVWVATLGTRTIDGDEPVTVKDHFRIGSNTKTMTGTVILQLVDEGKLALDDPVSKYWPETPNGENITIAQLLDMRSGLYNYSEDESFNARMDEDPKLQWAPEELLAIAFDKPPYFKPGEGFHYSNTNTVLLGLIAEKLTGKSLEDLYQERIFAKLGLKNSLLPAIDDASIPSPHPHGYMFGTNVSTLEDIALPKAEQEKAKDGTLLPNDVTNDNPSWGWAAGAAISNAEDLAVYVEALVDGGLLSDKLQKQRLASTQPIEPGNPQSASYGLGIAKFGPMIGHDGQLPGYTSFMARDPDRKITLIVLCSLFAGPDGEFPAVVLAKEVMGRIYGESIESDSPSHSKEK